MKAKDLKVGDQIAVSTKKTAGQELDGVLARVTAVHEDYTGIMQLSGADAGNDGELFPDAEVLLLVR